MIQKSLVGCSECVRDKVCAQTENAEDRFSSLDVSVLCSLWGYALSHFLSVEDLELCVSGSALSCAHGNMYIYIYIRVYIYTYICNTCICIYMFSYIFVFLYDIHIYIYKCIYAYIYLKMAYMYIYIVQFTSNQLH